MNKLLELKQRRAKLIRDNLELVQAAANETRGLTSEENANYDARSAEIVNLGATITKLEESEELDKLMRSASSAAAPATTPDEQKRKLAFRRFLSASPESLNELRAEVPFSDTGKGLALECRATTDPLSLTSALGGYTVPSGFLAKLLEALKWYGGVRGTAFEINTATGNDLHLPTVNDTGNTGILLTENTPVTNLNTTFAEIVFKAFKFSSDQVLISRELLQDSGVDIEGIIATMLGKRLGRIQNTYFTTGTGNGQPQGCVVGSAVGKTGGTLATPAVTFNDLVDLYYSVDKAYRNNPKAAFMMNDTTFQALHKLVDGNSRPLFLPYGASAAEKPVESLFGAPIVINNDMPTIAAAAKTILFGDFENFWLRNVLGLTLIRMNERYAEYDQVAFLALMRSDSRMMDAGTHPIKYFVHGPTS